MKTILENELCQVSINHFGAEISSFILKQEKLEYIWQGDSTFWGRHAPVLFPFVGRLKDDTYNYQGQSYPMSQHGFARDKEFTLESYDKESAVFLLASNEETKQVYPFDFELRLNYRLIGQELTVGYDVRTDSEEMYFSIGGHPAFNVPLTKETSFEDYYIHFAPSKSRFLLPLKGAYVDLKEKTLAQTNTSIQLNRHLFEKDAMILETIGENTFSILCDKTEHSVSLSYNDFPYVGIWTKYPDEASFICIEPWLGIADTTETSGNIEDKLGINRITPGEVFRQSYTIKIN